MASQTQHFHKTKPTVSPQSKTFHGLVPPKVGLIHQVRQKLALSLEELQRMEDEGGRPITPEQSEEMKKLSTAIHELDNLMDPEDDEEAVEN